MAVIYLDYNATTPLLAEVKQAMMSALDCVGNPSSIHQAGRKSRALVDQSRKQIAHAVDANASDIIFTSSGTEANHLALSGLRIAPENIYASAVEHSSIRNNILPQNLLSVDVLGQLDIEALKRAFGSAFPPKLVTLGLVNSETGIVQRKLSDIVKLCHDHNCIVHTDAVQAFGKIPLSFKSLGVDMMTIAAHKLGGPKGAAALICRDSVALKARYLGGGQEKGLRSGTENVPAIVGFGVAAEQIDLTKWASARTLLNELATQLRQSSKDVQIHSQTDGLPNTLSFSTPGYDKQMQVIHFDLSGIALSSGSACSSGKVAQSPVLKAMGLPDAIASSAIRVSVGPDISESDLAAFFNVWQKLLDAKKAEGY